MHSRLQLWTVDVSAFSLWQSGTKGEAIIDACLADSVEERARVKRYVREVDQIRSLAGKLLVRLALSTLRKDLCWESFQFQTTKEGKPFLSSPCLDFDYNITHDGDWVAVAFCGGGGDGNGKAEAMIGVDVMEIHLPRYEKTVEDFVETMDMTLTPRERAWILSEYTSDTFTTTSVPPAPLGVREYDRLKKLYTLWTYKEAFTKSRGLGLSFDFQNVEIDKSAEAVWLTASGQLEQHLHCFELVLPPGESRNSRSGAGTGLDSLLVAVQDRQEGTMMFKTSAEEAKQDGLLCMWTMSGLVEASLDVINNRNKGL